MTHLLKQTSTFEFVPDTFTITKMGKYSPHFYSLRIHEYEVFHKAWKFKAWNQESSAPTSHEIAVAYQKEKLLQNQMQRRERSLVS